MAAIKGHDCIVRCEHVQANSEQVILAMPKTSCVAESSGCNLLGLGEVGARRASHVRLSKALCFLLSLGEFIDSSL